MSPSESPWSTLYRDALLSIFSFVEFKELPTVLAVCRSWLTQSGHEKCREVVHDFRLISDGARLRNLWSSVDLAAVVATMVSSHTLPAPDFPECPTGGDYC
jgi:hypothetical protein